MKSFVSVLSLCVFCSLAALQTGTAAGNKQEGPSRTPSGQSLPPSGGSSSPLGLPGQGSNSTPGIVPGGADSRVKWEYAILAREEIKKRGAGDFVAGLNKLGEEGWELISMMGSRGAPRAEETLFKRLRQDRQRARPAQDLAPNQFDPGMIFDRMAKGSATINISDLRIGQEDAQAWAQKKGITNAQLTRDQFISFFQSPEAQQTRERMRAQFRGGAGDSDRRLSDLERRLDEVMRQLERMRQDMQRLRPDQGRAPDQTDPGKIFDRIAKGRATIKISDLGWGQEDVQAWAQKKGITNAQLTRDQYIAYSQSPEAVQARERMRAPFRGEAGGGGDSDRRLREMERKLDEVLRQLERMRQDMQRARPDQRRPSDQRGGQPGGKDGKGGVRAEPRPKDDGGPPPQRR